MHRGDRATLVRIRSLLESDHVHRSSILVHIFGTDLSCYIFALLCPRYILQCYWNRPFLAIETCPLVSIRPISQWEGGGREWTYSDSPSSEAFHCPLLPLLSILRVDFFFPLSTIYLSNPV
mmetsp:Transcript_18479/g.26607  ORF Transcript_18479/g.26607 Transcript_18479/m.26607 type:complete len:121 (+) Transcript_18479:553-915(+)